MALIYWGRSASSDSKQNRRTQISRERETDILLVNGKPVIDPRRQDEQIPRLGSNPHPSIVLVSDVEVSRPLQDVSDLLVFMDMFVVEQPDLLVVGCAHSVGRNGDFVAVGVVARLGNVFHFSR